jgi:hypothetical protein
MYGKNVFILFLLFGAFNAIVGQNLTLNAFNLSPQERKIVLLVPLAYVAIAVVIGGGFIATVLDILAFVLIYAKVTNRI